MVTLLERGKRPSYIMLKNGVAEDVVTAGDLFKILLRAKKDDTILICDNLSPKFTPIAMKFDGTNEWLTMAFFGDECKKRTKDFTYTSFGIDRTAVVSCPLHFKSTLFNFDYYADYNEFDKKFYQLWMNTMVEVNDTVVALLERVKDNYPNEYNY